MCTPCSTCSIRATPSSAKYICKNISGYSVVVKDVPAYTVYGGNPARFIKERFDAELKDLLLRYQWWNLEPEKLVEILPLLCDPDLEKLRRFLRKQLTD